LTEPLVWEALLERMPTTAMIRNLATMTRIGLLKPLSKATNLVCERLRDKDRLKAARIHPYNVLVAQDTYQSGRGFRGSNTWNPVPQINDALEDAFHLSFDTVEPTGKRHLFALDVSGSMRWEFISDSMISA